jgi:Glycosyl transferase family 2/N-terminal domain of galactosyltransferase
MNRIGGLTAVAIAAIGLIAWLMRWLESREWKPPWHRRRHRRHGAGRGISLLVPFTSDDGLRELSWRWLQEYWLSALPGAEICTAASLDTPFCKTKAVNEAFRHSTGDVIVILDADAYLDASSILKCAHMIRANRRLSFVPYRRLYRLTPAYTARIIAASPVAPVILPTDPPPPGEWVDEGGSSAGHWFGALCQILPREAFVKVGGMDPRFAGWGGEDVSFMRSVDTLHGRHKSLDAPAYHLWHPTTSARSAGGERQWANQPAAVMNGELTYRYTLAFGDRDRMQALVDERADG